MDLGTPPTDFAFLARADHAREWLAPSLSEDWPNLPILRGEGAYVYAADGRRYLDFVSGMAACNLGHCHPRVVAAAKAQIDRFIHGPLGVFLYDSVLKASEELARITGPLSRFFWGNSGTEAIEGALKLARYVTERPGIIGFIGGFHGRSFGSASLTTSNVSYRRRIQPLLPSIHHVPFPYCLHCRHRNDFGCCDDSFINIERLFSYVVPPEEVAAILVEPILGEGGYVVPPSDFLPRLRELCSRHGILLIFDEIQTGFGRTGQMFAWQTFEVQPDILVVSKSLASGFPLSAVAASPDLMSRWAPSSHGTTFGGNPVSCAAAVATMQVFREEKVLDNVSVRSAEAFGQLTELAKQSPHIGDVRGKGLMIGLEFVNSSTRAPAGAIARQVLEGCLAKGLILYPAGESKNVVRFIPPLTVSHAELDQGLFILSEVVQGLPG